MSSRIRPILPLLAVAAAASCSVEPIADLYNGTGAPVVARVAGSQRAGAPAHEDLPIAAGNSARLRGSALPPPGFSIVAGGCVYAYRLWSGDLEAVKKGGAATYPIPLEVGPDMVIHLRPSKRLGAPKPETFGFPRRATSKICQ